MRASISPLHLTFELKLVCEAGRPKLVIPDNLYLSVVVMDGTPQDKAESTLEHAEPFQLHVRLVYH